MTKTSNADRRAKHRAPFCAALLALSLFSVRCETYDAPPRSFIVGLADGVLRDPTQTLSVGFSEPVKAETLRVKVIRLETDTEGNLFDEDADAATTPEVLVDYPHTSAPQKDETGKTVDDTTVAVLSTDRLTLSLKPPKALPTGPRLAVVIEAGLSDDAGNTVRDRQRLTFGYDFVPTGTTKSKLFVEGTYFMLVDVKKPLAAQVQLFANFRLNDDGTFSAQFTNADRKPAQVCPEACRASQVCRLLPAPDCVAPSERAGEPVEYPDYYPFAAPPAGYTFPVTGGVEDQGGAAVMQANPVDVVVQQPKVTLQQARFTGAFETKPDGTVVASGSLAAPTVLLNDKPLGTQGGEGSFKALLVPLAALPEGVPPAP